MLESLPKIDGSIPAQAQLNPGEELIASQAGVGLYDKCVAVHAHQPQIAHPAAQRPEVSKPPVRQHTCDLTSASVYI